MASALANDYLRLLVTDARPRIPRGRCTQVPTNWNEGITSCPVAMHGRPPQADAARVLGLPDEHVVAMVITFGYPESQESLHRGMPRTPLAELVHHERW